MRMRNRIAAAERQVGMRKTRAALIIWGGRDDGIWRARAEEAKRRGSRIRIIRIGLQDFAETVDEAEALIAKHRAKRKTVISITIYRGSVMPRKKEVLAHWEAELPEWLRAAVDPS